MTHFPLASSGLRNWNRRPAASRRRWSLRARRERHAAFTSARTRASGQTKPVRASERRYSSCLRQRRAKLGNELQNVAGNSSLNSGGRIIHHDEILTHGDHGESILVLCPRHDLITLRGGAHAHGLTDLEVFGYIEHETVSFAQGEA